MTGADSPSKRVIQQLDRVDVRLTRRTWLARLLFGVGLVGALGAVVVLLADSAAYQILSALVLFPAALGLMGLGRLVTTPMLVRSQTVLTLSPRGLQVGATSLPWEAVQEVAIGAVEGRPQLRITPRTAGEEPLVVDDLTSAEAAWLEQRIREGRHRALETGEATSEADRRRAARLMERR